MKKDLAVAALLAATACWFSYGCPGSRPAPGPGPGANRLKAEVPARDYAGTAPELTDPQAGAAAKALYARLRGQYGRKIFSGQTSKYFAELTSLAGNTPALRAFDLQNYSPRNPWRADWSPWDDGTVQAAIDWHRGTGGKGIVTVQWHWLSPSGGLPRTNTFYTKETTFDVSKAVVPGTREYGELLRDIDAIAAQLKRLRDAGVPVLWRPLHEAGGRWFWWGAKGPGPCLKLYDLVYRRLTGYHQLHNLIWVWATPEPEWYPGNDKVDIVGYDSYPGARDYSPQKETFDKLYKLVNGRKLIALTENGPIPDIGQALAADARWSYFMSWAELVTEQNSPEHIREVFGRPDVITIESDVVPR
ncbi:MAG TPA: glycosyl hydrolase [Elusimicrobiales bacterium]|mgnify:CR=1 FL=1|nr:glycosyl hydrolase [Elusimicrobiales bacterium]